MIVLDTNVLSELMRPAPAGQVVAWLDECRADQVFLTAVTVAEVLRGINRMPDGLRREVLVAKAGELLDRVFDDRVVAFDGAAAAQYAVVTVARERAGRPISMADAQIAAICRLHGAELATRNAKDFVGTGVRVLDPWAFYPGSR